MTEEKTKPMTPAERVRFEKSIIAAHLKLKCGMEESRNTLKETLSAFRNPELRDEVYKCLLCQPLVALDNEKEIDWLFPVAMTAYMSDKARKHIFTFWSAVQNVLNSAKEHVQDLEKQIVILQDDRKARADFFAEVMDQNRAMKNLLKTKYASAKERHEALEAELKRVKEAEKEVVKQLQEEKDGKRV